MGPKHFKAILYLCIAFHPSAFSQARPVSPEIPENLTLEVAMQRFLEFNPILQTERANQAITEARQIGARARPNPALRLNSESYPLFESRPGPFLNRQELTLAVEQEIETGGKRARRMEVAAQEAAVTAAEIEDLIRRLTFRLKQTYFEIVLAKLDLRVAQEVLARFDRVIQLNRLRYEHGEISGGDFRRVETERLRFLEDVIAADVRLENARAALLSLMGVTDFGRPFDVSETLDVRELAYSVAALNELALRNRADLLAQRRRRLRAESQVRLEQALGKPNWTPFFGYKRDLGDNAVALGINIPIPIFNRNQGGVARALAERQKEEWADRRVQAEILLEVQQVFTHYQANRRRMQALETEFLRKAEQSREIAESAYRLGASDLISFLDVERTYRETLKTYHRARFDNKISLFALEMVVGKEF